MKKKRKNILGKKGETFKKEKGKREKRTELGKL